MSNSEQKTYALPFKTASGEQIQWVYYLSDFSGYFQIESGKAQPPVELFQEGDYMKAVCFLTAKGIYPGSQSVTPAQLKKLLRNYMHSFAEEGLPGNTIRIELDAYLIYAGVHPDFLDWGTLEARIAVLGKSKKKASDKKLMINFIHEFEEKYK